MTITAGARSKSIQGLVLLLVPKIVCPKDKPVGNHIRVSKILLNTVDHIWYRLGAKGEYRENMAKNSLILCYGLMTL